MADEKVLTEQELQDKEYQKAVAEREARAKQLALSFSHLIEQQGYTDLKQMLIDLRESIKEECMSCLEIDGVKWYQAEYAILSQILKQLDAEEANVGYIANTPQE